MSDETLNDPDIIHKLGVWHIAKTQLEQAKENESSLRKNIFGRIFKKPKEGTNKIALGDGYVLNGKYTINRKVDEAALDAHRARLQSIGIPIDQVIVYKPSLSKKAYTKLTPEQRLEVDNVLQLSEGSPALDIIPPSK